MNSLGMSHHASFAVYHLVSSPINNSGQALQGFHVPSTVVYTLNLDIILCKTVAEKYMGGSRFGI